MATVNPTRQSEPSTSDNMEEFDRPRKEGFFVSLRQFWESVRMTVFVVGGLLVVFASARNTITWHLQKFWGASGNYWQSCWESIYDGWFEGDDRFIGVTGSSIVYSSVFIFGNLFFVVMDTTGRPKFLHKYKIQRDKNAPVETTKFLKCLFWVFFNATVISGPGIIASYHLFKLRGCSFGRELPTFHWTLFELVMFALLEEFGFYYSHRFLHQPGLYKKFHKWHHEWTAPISITSIYCHPLEHVMSNLIPALLGPLLMGSHLATTWLWITIVLLSTTNSHCGYHFPLMPSPEAHDFHHLKFNNCFGILGVLDRLHDTDSAFRRTKQYQRHYTFLGLTPLTNVIPDEECRKGKMAPKQHQE